MFLIHRLTIQSKFILAMLVVSIGSVLAISILGLMSGRDALRTAAYHQLIAVRESRADELRTETRFVRNQLLSLAEDPMVVGAMAEFHTAYRKLADKPLPPDKAGQLKRFYEKEYLPAAVQGADAQPLPEMYLPAAAAARYLQYHYIAANPHPFGKRDALNHAGDGSEYSAVHQKYHRFFRDFAARFGYDDLLLVEHRTGDVVYSARKTTEFATSLYTGPYAETNLGRLVQSMRKVKERGSFHVAGFEPYQPELGRPTAFVAAPVCDGPVVIGLLVLRFPIGEFNRVLTGNNGWERDGLGKTGEVYLVGSDSLMRSVSRFFVESPDAYLDRLRAAGYPEEEIQRIRQAGTTVLTQAVHTGAVEDGLAGKTGTMVGADYRNEPVLAAYAPLQFGGRRAVIVAQMDESEAFQGATALRRRIIALTVAIALAAMLFAAVLAHVFTRPINRLIEGAKRLSGGETDVQVSVSTADEIGDLARAFNELARTVQAKTEQIAQQVRANEELLSSSLPAVAVERLRKGDQEIAESHPDVTVLVAEMVGLSELAESLPADQAARLLNEIVVALDELAERHGVEKVRSGGASYVAVCGLSVPRPDHAHRMVEFALEALTVVRHFNQGHGTRLGVRIGINDGAVAGGLIGRKNRIYHLWGETLNAARDFHRHGKPDCVQVSRSVHDRLGEQYEFDGPVAIELPGGASQSVWVVKGPAA
ncbi:MAG TPA: adenylate/guanylate cyclase domain-containing protein [Gemmataceae bacterium]|nr:adenylate/guanylate cyclase domain-containing protein [Gemmataceae bacterium]